MLPFPEEFFLGANLPWVDYGCDYGASAWFPEGGLGARPEALARFERAMDRLAAGGVTIARVFLLCDGRSGFPCEADGAPRGLDEAFFRDFDLALSTACARGVRLLPVVLDFHLCDPAQEVEGVTIGGRRAFVTDEAARDLLLSRVVGPIAERYGAHPGIVAWDLFNEPEWRTAPFAPGDGPGVVPFAAMQAFLVALIGCVRERARQPLTVGSASAAHLDLVRGIGLDLYQVHWYERFGWPALAAPVGRLDLDRPVLLGEFPGRPADTTSAVILSAAREAGHCGALIWSVLSDDSVSGFPDGSACRALRVSARFR